ncbi:MAG: hypothetical protein ACLU4J_04445 [Butyricimonas paravirosa]
MGSLSGRPDRPGYFHHAGVSMNVTGSSFEWVMQYDRNYLPTSVSRQRYIQRRFEYYFRKTVEKFTKPSPKNTVPRV